MATSEISIKLRPIKLAFLVDMKDTNAVLEAIKINTFLWGGRFNPIIPVFSRTSKIWQKRTFGNKSAKDIIAGYVNAYDPDFIVQMCNCPYLNLIAGDRQTISVDKIVADAKHNRFPHYGIGLFEILDYFIHEELRFIRREPINIFIPRFKKPYSLFLASVFGELPDDLDKVFWNRYSKQIGANKVKCDISNYSNCWKNNRFYFSGLSSLYINKVKPHSWFGDSYIFYLDATKTSDIIDYWNLRALGWNVIPVPKQAFKKETIKKFVRNFIEKNFYPYKYSSNIYHNTTIIKSYYTTSEEMEQFVNSLGIVPPSKSNQLKVAFQHWYPRIWDEWAREKDNAECCDLESDSTEYEPTGKQGSFRLKTLTPKFINRSSFGKACFANEIIIHSYGDKVPIAEVFPQGGRELAGAFGFMLSPSEHRFSKKGLVYLSPYPNLSVSLIKPEAEDIFLAWLENRGWQAELSPAGRIAKQMLKQLGGICGINILANENLVELLGEMQGEKIKKHSEFNRRISKFIKPEWGDIDKGKLQEFTKNRIQKLVNVGVIQVGMELQCPICHQRSWYSIKEVDYSLKCPKCLAQFHFPSHSPKKIQWSYRTVGPFSSSNQAYGAYSVLLTLRFFTQLLHGAITPITSFVLIKDKKEIGEVDLGLFFRELRFLSGKIEVIFAECKTYNRFTRKDIKRMRVIANKFPGAVMVFATLRDSFTKSEKKYLCDFVSKYREYWEANRPYNPVLILTGTELFSDLGPPFCWREKGDIYAEAAKNFSAMYDLFHLCDITQQLYLGLEPWQEWLEKQRGTFQSRRAVKSNWKEITE